MAFGKLVLSSHLPSLLSWAWFQTPGQRLSRRTFMRERPWDQLLLGEGRGHEWQGDKLSCNAASGEVQPRLR